MVVSKLILEGETGGTIVSNDAFREWKERNTALSQADLLADTSCDTPLTEDHISIFRTSNEPIAIKSKTVQQTFIKSSLFYAIKRKVYDFSLEKVNR